MREPAFWWREAGVAAGLLAPLAALYGITAARRLASQGWCADVPVVCIGNPTIGGAGKTPLALAVVRMLSEAGERPVLLSRGYGGKVSGPVQVDLTRHRSVDVGDEPLLLARAAPTIVARDRVAGAKAAVSAGAGVVVMDDGFQNPSLAKDFSILVVDARRGIGNGKVIPAGPLRAPLAAQIARADALVVVGELRDIQTVLGRMPTQHLPAFRASLAPDENFIAALAGKRVLAFAGIGDPEKFFATLRNGGIVVAGTRAFADHHRYTRADAEALCEHAGRESLILATTEKDAARMQGDDALAELSARARALPVTLVLEDEADFKTLLLEKVEQAGSDVGRRSRN
jgi:tetraacyldisaccharide 4'-kinase